MLGWHIVTGADGMAVAPGSGLAQVTSETVRCVLVMPRHLAMRVLFLGSTGGKAWRAMGTAELCQTTKHKLSDHRQKIGSPQRAYAYYSPPNSAIFFVRLKV